MEYTFIEKRQHQRFDVATAIYVEVVRRGSQSEADNVILRCETVDVSIRGLKIWVPAPIPPKSKLNLAVPMTDWKENLELAGQAMWVTKAENQDGYWVGLALMDTSHEDMEKWCRVVHQLKKSAA